MVTLMGKQPSATTAIRFPPMKILTIIKSLNNNPRLPARHRQALRNDRQSSGFGMTEALVAVAAGTLIIGAGALAMRSTQTLIKGSGEKATQRQNITNGLRLMRSEIERSQFVLVSGQTEGSPKDTDLAGESYQGALNHCKGLATRQESEFLPVFGLKMPDEEDIPPVIYGISEASAGSSQYAIKRCGTPLNTAGEYDQLQADGSDNPPFISTIIGGVGMMPKQQCEEEGWENIQECTQYTSGGDHEIKYTALEVLQSLNGNSPFMVTDNKTPERFYQEPALRIQTDNNRKFFKIISPNCPDQNNCEEYSFTEIARASRSLSKQPLMLTAFARADKRLVNSKNGNPVDPTSNNQVDDGNQTDGLGGGWFPNVTSSRVRFLLDGSGSMSACMDWRRNVDGNLERGENWRTFYTPPGDPVRRGNYTRTNAICNETRMERLQLDLITLLDSLPDETMISLEAFSSENYQNNRRWSVSRNNLVRIGDSNNRQGAKDFVNSLNDGSPNRWGGTYPWPGLQRAFNDTETDTLYFLSDGLPTEAPDGFREWAYQNYMPAATYYTSYNDNRDTQLKVNTTAVGVNAPWMLALSEKASGAHLQSQ